MRSHAFLTLLATATCALGTAAPALAQDVKAEVIEQQDGTRTLVHEAIIEAPLARVWATFTTEEGWKDWGPKFAMMDVRPGGSIESSYFADAGSGDARNILHRILAIVPERMIAMRLERVPEGGPVSKKVMAETWVVYELTPLGDNRTQLRILGLGYGEGEDFDRVVQFFHSGNTYSIELLRKNIAAQE